MIVWTSGDEQIVKEQHYCSALKDSTNLSVFAKNLGMEANPIFRKK